MGWDDEDEDSNVAKESLEEISFNIFRDKIFACLITNQKGIIISKDLLSIKTDKYNKTTVFHEDKVVANFSLQQLQGCCGVCVSYHSLIQFSYRGTGLGNVLCELRIDIARRKGYGLLICTDVDNNVPQKKIMENLNFKRATQFTNPRTKHLVNLHYIHLTE